MKTCWMYLFKTSLKNTHNMDEKDIFSYITTEATNFRTARVPLTSSKSWNMIEHIERCTNVANGWFNRGSNEDGLRPYNDIVTPIVDVSFRSEGFDVKDIVPFVDDKDSYHLSFLIKKYHPQWARKHQIDTFIDDVVESSVIFDLALIKSVNNEKPELVDLKTIAFCDQSNVMVGPLCIRHQYTISELVEFKGKWYDDKIDMAIVMSLAQKKEPLAHDQTVKTPSKYIEVYELRGNLPERWLYDDAEMYKYCPQMHIVCYYTGEDGNKNGITLYKGKDKPLSSNFKALKIDRIRSKGRACGRSIVERLFEPQVWNNYAGIKLKEMLDSAVNLLQTDSDEISNQKLTGLPNFTVLKHEQGKPLSRVDMNLQNVPAVQNFQIGQENQAQKLGSASDASLGKNPVSGTPFSTTNALLQQGEGIHKYRQGKIATFFADELYADWILSWLVKDMNAGKKFSEELSLDEIQEIADKVIGNQVEKRIKDMIFKEGKVITEEERDTMKDTLRTQFLKGGNRRFMEILKGELESIPIKVFVNITGKQANLAENADKMSNLIRELLRAGVPIASMSKQLNELFENSGLSPMNFTNITEPVKAPEAPITPVASPLQSNVPVQ